MSAKIALLVCLVMVLVVRCMSNIASVHEEFGVGLSATHGNEALTMGLRLFKSIRKRESAGLNAAGRQQVSARVQRDKSELELARSGGNVDAEGFGPKKGESVDVEMIARAVAKFLGDLGFLASVVASGSDSLGGPDEFRRAIIERLYKQYVPEADHRICGAVRQTIQELVETLYQLQPDLSSEIFDSQD